MRLLTFCALIALSLPSTAIATTTLNPIPAPSEPCRTVSTPHGDMCVPKVAKALKVYGIIRTEYKTDAKRICHGMAGDGYEVWETKEPNEWLCVKKI
jgi:hypothetical protein